MVDTGFKLVDFEDGKGPPPRINAKPNKTGVFYIKNSPF